MIHRPCADKSTERLRMWTMESEYVYGVTFTLVNTHSHGKPHTAVLGIRLMENYNTNFHHDDVTGISS